MNFIFVHKWHKRLGIITAAFVLFLSVTGLLLNHTTELDLSGKHVRSNWLLNWYDIEVSDKQKSFVAKAYIVTQLGERLYLNDKEIEKGVENLIGVLPLNDQFVIAYDQKLMLLNSSAELIEVLSSVDGVPAGMKNLGVGESDELVIHAAHGFYTVDLESLDWHEEDHMNATWSESIDISQALFDRIKEQYRGTGLPLERVVQDIHSGRILGQWGVYFMDFVSVLFIILAISGIYMWCRRH